jgi:hypothetical protein
MYRLLMSSDSVLFSRAIASIHDRLGTASGTSYSVIQE